MIIEKGFSTGGEVIVGIEPIFVLLVNKYTQSTDITEEIIEKGEYSFTITEPGNWYWVVFGNKISL